MHSSITPAESGEIKHTFYFDFCTSFRAGKKHVSKVLWKKSKYSAFFFNCINLRNPRILLSTHKCCNCDNYISLAYYILYLSVHIAIEINYSAHGVATC